MREFNTDDSNVELVVFDDVIEHVLRIDRVLMQTMGHLLLVGSSGAGKTTLTKYVCWRRNYQTFCIRPGRDYALEDFDTDLREVMLMSGLDLKHVVFTFDESNNLGPAFLEKMNALLAAGEIPGLFEGDELTKLTNKMKSMLTKEGKFEGQNDDEI